MAKTTSGSSLARALLSREKHDQFLAALSVMMVIVALFVFHSVMRQGITLTHKETVLDCHYVGEGAHKHSADCYDKGANLVCPLEERELHKHEDSCYTTHMVLTCDLEEGEDHTHTDECYETVKVLTCGKEEVTEEHVHGPGCFKTVTVRNSDGEIIEVDEDRANIEGMELMEEPEEEVEVQGEPADEVDEGSLEASAVDDEATDVAPTSDTTTSTEEEDADSGESTSDEDPTTSDDTTEQDASEDASEQEATTVETVDAEGKTHHLIVADDNEHEDSDMPAQGFDKVIKDVEGNVLVHVIVRAPEGAFPAGTTMRVVPVTTHDVAGSIEEAVASQTSRKVSEIQAVDITFHDAAGNEIEPAKKITVKMTSDLIGTQDDPLVVHVDNEGVADVVETTSDSSSTLHFDEDRF